VSFSFRPGDSTSYAVYLLDTYGGQELLYRDEELSAMYPMILRPRPAPLRLADTTAPARGHGEMFVADVNQGLPPEWHGLARHIRIVEAHERHIHTRPYNIEVGPDSGFEVKTVLGTVPVERDGSAYFRVPAGKAIFLSVLDENHQALHTMRMTTDVKPGERIGCVGCHEPMEQAPAARGVPLAVRRPASEISPLAMGVKRMGFVNVVQPILSRHCIRCHDGSSDEGKAFDLTTTKTQAFMSVPIECSYYNLRRYVKHAPINTYFLGPGSWGSRVSPLTRHLAKGHNQVRLSAEEWEALCAWIDCNAPYIGDYRIVAADPAVRQGWKEGRPAPGEGCLPTERIAIGSRP
jgi:hypothetical protein